MGIFFVDYDVARRYGSINKLDKNPADVHKVKGPMQARARGGRANSQLGLLVIGPSLAIPRRAPSLHAFAHCIV